MSLHAFYMVTIYGLCACLLAHQHNKSGMCARPIVFAYGGLLSLENGIFSLRPFLKKIMLEIMFYTLEGLFVMIFPSLSNVCS